jgi:MFS family permease
MKSLLGLLRRRRDYRRLWMGESVSLLGDWLSYVAVSLLALASGDGAMGLAIVFAAHTLPSALTSPLAGVLADRWDRRRLLIGVQLTQAALMLGMVAAASADNLLAVELLLFARTAAGGFLYPAKNAALRRLVQHDELVDANTIDATTWSITFTVGTALGGIVALAGPVVALSIDAFTFVIAALLFATLPALPVESSDEPAASQRPPKTSAVAEVAEAWRAIWNDAELLEATFSKAPVAVAGGAAWVLLNLTADELGLFGSAALALGLLQSVRGIGTALGPLMGRQLIDKGWSAMSLLRASVWLALASIAAFALSSNWGALLLTTLAWGAAGGGYWVFSASEIQRLATDRVIGRVSSLDQLFFTFGTSAAALAGGAVVTFSHQPSAAAWFGVAIGGALYLALRLTVRSRASALATPRTQPASTNSQLWFTAAQRRWRLHQVDSAQSESFTATQRPSA